MNDQIIKAEDKALYLRVRGYLEPEFSEIGKRIDELSHNMSELHSRPIQSYISKWAFSIENEESGSSIARTVKGWVKQLDYQDYHLHKKIDRLIAEATKERVNLRKILTGNQQEVSSHINILSLHADKLSLLTETLGNLVLFLAGAFAGMKYQEVAEGIKEIMAQLEDKH
jgi:hypothetical protein